MSDIKIFGIIGDAVRGEDIVNQIDAIKNRTADPITVEVFSDGGSIFEGLLIFNALRMAKNKIDMLVHFAGSITATIVMAGDTIRMFNNGRMFIHNPLAGEFGFMEAKELRKDAAELDGHKKDITNSFLRTGMSVAAISKLMDEETFLNADKALAFGFIDEILDSSKMVAQLNKKDLISWSDEIQTKKEENEMSGIMDKIKDLPYMGKVLAVLKIGATPEQITALDAIEVDAVKEENEELKKKLALVDSDKARTEIIAQLEKEGKVNKEMKETKWLSLLTNEALQEWGKGAPKIVAVNDGSVDDLSDEPEDNVKIQEEKTGSLVEMKFNSVNPAKKIEKAEA